MALLLAIIGFSIFIGYRAEKMDKRRFLVLLGFITLAVVVQLAAFYVSPPQKLFVPYEQRHEHAEDEGAVGP